MSNINRETETQQSANDNQVKIFTHCMCTYGREVQQTQCRTVFIELNTLPLQTHQIRQSCILVTVTTVFFLLLLLRRSLHRILHRAQEIPK